MNPNTPPTRATPNQDAPARPPPRQFPVLRAAQIDYFRIARHNWALILTRARQLGADAVVLPIYWGWHEIDDGQFDLSGQSHPRRNLLGLLDLCAGMGLKLIARIDPLIGDGVLGHGAPLWLLKRAPEILARRADGTPWIETGAGQTRPSALHPLYLEYVRRWFEHLMQTLNAAPCLESVVAVQLGDQTHPADHNAHVTQTLGPIWLRKRYTTIAALNTAHHTSYTSFSQARLASAPSTTESVQFARWRQAHSRATYIKLARTAGWNKPFWTPATAPTGRPILGLQHIKSKQITAIVVRPAVAANPDPPDVGGSARWGMNAPIGSDGAQRPAFEAVRAILTHPAIAAPDGPLSADDLTQLLATDAAAGRDLGTGNAPRSLHTKLQVCRRALIRDAAHLIETLDATLHEIDWQSETGATAQNTLARTVASLHKASNYARQLRATLENRPTPAANALPGSIRLTPDALTRIEALDATLREGADTLNHLLEQPPTDARATQSIASLRRRLNTRLGRLRADLRTGEIAPHQIGAHLEHALTGALQALFNISEL